MFKSNQIILTYSLLYFICAFLLSIYWFNNGYFNVFNIFFDTDPSSNLNSFAHGWGRHAISHALIEIIAIPIRAVALLMYETGLINDQVHFRKLAAFSVSPLASALSIIVFSKVLESLNLSKKEVILFTFIYSLSFTNIVFSAIPETYAISSLFITALMLFYLKEVNTNNYINSNYWFAAGFILTGTTITNGCIFFIIYFSSLYLNRKQGFLKSVSTSSALSFLILIIIVMFYELSHYVLEIPKGPEGGPEWIKRYTSNSVGQVLSNLMNFGSSSISSFFPLGFTYGENIHCIKNNMNCNAISLQHDFFSLSLLLKFLLFLIFLAFTYKKTYEDVNARNLYYLCSFILLFNLILHTIFGRETFMYTQHWISALTILLSLLLTQKRSYILTFLTLQIIFNINFFLNVNNMVSMS